MPDTGTPITCSVGVQAKTNTDLALIWYSLFRAPAPAGAGTLPRIIIIVVALAFRVVTCASLGVCNETDMRNIAKGKYANSLLGPQSGESRPALSPVADLPCSLTFKAGFWEMSSVATNLS